MPSARTSDGLRLHTPDGALALALPPGMRAFELVGTSGRVDRLVLTLHRTRLTGVFVTGVAELGPDMAAVDAARRGELLFDLGLGRPPIRFCIRTGDTGLVARLRAAAGADALGPANGLLPHLLAASPDRVVSSPVGRIEVTGPIQRAAPSGPHTRLLPDLLAQERLLEPGFALPEGYLPCATLVPDG